MRRTLVVSMALFAVVNAPAAAQTCLGLASHSTGQMQVGGNAQFTDISNSYGASFGYGQPAGIFAKANLGRTSYDGLDGGATDIGAQVGYQLTVGRTAQMQVCPVASLSLGMGPNDVDGGGTDLSTRQGNIGFAFGKVMSSSPSMQIVPNRRRKSAASCLTCASLILTADAGGAVVLLRAAHVVRPVPGREHVVELPGWIILIGPGLAGVDCDVATTVVGLHHPLVVGGRYPQDRGCRHAERECSRASFLHRWSERTGR